MFWKNLVAAVGVAAYSFIMAYLLFRLIGTFMDLHIPLEKRMLGLDVSFHGESVVAQGNNSLTHSPADVYRQYSTSIEKATMSFLSFPLAPACQPASSSISSSHTTNPLNPPCPSPKKQQNNAQHRPRDVCAELVQPEPERRARALQARRLGGRGRGRLVRRRRRSAGVHGEGGEMNYWSRCFDWYQGVERWLMMMI